MQSILKCVGLRQRLVSSRRVKYMQYQACIYGAVQNSRGQLKWRFSQSIECWRINHSDAIRDAMMHAAAFNMVVLPHLRPGDSVKLSMVKPDPPAGSNPAETPVTE